MNRFKTILLAGGGTGGPATPLLAIASSLKEQFDDVNIIFVGTEDGPERNLVEQEDLQFVSLRAAKLRRYLSWRNILDIFVLPYSVWKAALIINKHKVDVVVGAGAYVSVPVIWAAKLLRRKVLIHQQDVTPSLSNKLSRAFADVVTLTFEEQRKDFALGVVTGNPVRQSMLRGDRERAASVFGLSADKPTVLIYGGGTGSLEINNLTEKAVGSLLDSGLQIIHITGKNVAPGAFLGALGGGCVRKQFLGSELADAYALADIVVSRAGLGSISELSLLKKPVLIIPMPDSHQEKNAELLREKNAAIILEQKNLSVESFAEQILELWKDEEKKKIISKNISEIMPHGASDTIAMLVYNLAK